MRLSDRDGSRRGELFSAEGLQNLEVTHFLRPGTRARPTFGVTLFGVGSVFEEQLHKPNARPSARPTEGSAAQGVVATIEKRRDRVITSPRRIAPGPRHTTMDAPANSDPVSFAGRDALVGIKAAVEEKLEHVAPIIPHRDRGQAALAPVNMVCKFTFGETGAQPLEIRFGDGCAGGFVLGMRGWIRRIAGRELGSAPFFLLDDRDNVVITTFASQGPGRRRIAMGIKFPPSRWRLCA